MMKFVALFTILATTLSVSLDKRAGISVSGLLQQTGGKEEILQLIEQLRSDNTEAIDLHTTKRDNAVHDEAAKLDTLEKAKAAEKHAMGLVQDKKLEIVELEKDVNMKRAAEAEAKKKLSSAQNAADAAAQFLVDENNRIDDEKKILEDVLELLDQLAGSAQLLENDSLATRRLLSIVDLSSLLTADPTTITEVGAMINDLINAGEAERTKAIDADKVAQADLAAADSAHKNAWDKLATALGRVEFANAELKVLIASQTSATKAKNEAENAHELSLEALETAKKELQIEEARVEREEEVFVQVTQLLATLQ